MTVRTITVQVGGAGTEAAHARSVEHLYVSTGCQHGVHDYCAKSDTKKPAECKFCAAPCLCPCHITNWTMTA
jgi:hypothetical protein